MGMAEIAGLQTATVPATASGPILQRKCACGNHSSGGECRGCQKKRGMLQRKPAGSHEPSRIPSIVNDVLRSAGEPLEPAARDFFEPRLGHDFSGVRVHTDSSAAESAAAVGAHAYTVGRDIVFARGQYSADTGSGRKLIAHELTHVVQQSRSGLSSFSPSMRVSEPGDAAEREADAQADRVVSGGSASLIPASIGAAAPAIARRGDPARLPPGGLACEVAVDNPPAVVERVLFGNLARTLTPLQRVQVDNFIVNWRAAGGNVPVRVDGYASTDGTDELNWGLSCDRAQDVVNELTAPAAGIPGVPAGLIRTVAQGETAEFGAAPENRRATISAAFPARPTPPPGAPAATGVVFSESRSPAEQFAGYDPSVVPNVLTVPVGGARVAEAAIAPAGAAPTFVSLDTSIATVVATAGGISVSGVAAGSTSVEAREGAVVLATLRIDVKNRRDIGTGVHYICDSAAPAPHCTTGTTADTPGLLVRLNNIWERQANVRFNSTASVNRTAPGDLGPTVDSDGFGGGEMAVVTALGTGAAYNIFRVSGVTSAGNPVNGALNNGNNTLLADVPCGDGFGPPHEAGHFLGLGHGDHFVMDPCGVRTTRRVVKAMVDRINP